MPKMKPPAETKDAPGWRRPPRRKRPPVLGTPTCRQHRHEARRRYGPRTVEHYAVRGRVEYLRCAYCEEWAAWLFTEPPKQKYEEIDPDGL